MRFEEQKRAGSGITSASRSLLVFSFAIFVLIAAGAVFAQALYKYRGENGQWIYSDRAPQQHDSVEIRELSKGEKDSGVTVSQQSSDGRFRIIARNDYYTPVQVLLDLEALHNLTFPPPEIELLWVVPARSQLLLLELALLDSGLPANAEFREFWVPGDPRSTHSPAEPYRAPFAIASASRISQAFPLGTTHRTPDSYYAVDFKMPVGTGIYAARAGIVFDVSSTHFGGGLNSERYLDAANVVRILHDDGSFAVYAHLNWNTVRVRPGDTVKRGEYIADSGNTGFSSGPHLHFVVVRNKGMRLESVPIVFQGANGSKVAPVTGSDLVAY